MTPDTNKDSRKRYNDLRPLLTRFDETTLSRFFCDTNRKNAKLTLDRPYSVLNRDRRTPEKNRQWFRLMSWITIPSFQKSKKIVSLILDFEGERNRI